MPPQTIEQRVDKLERRVTRLERLPARIDALTLQVSQLTTEMHDEFSAVRTEMREMGDELRDELREDMRTMHYDLSAKILEHGVQMRALHEEVMGRIAVLSEAVHSQRRRRQTPPK